MAKISASAHAPFLAAAAPTLFQMESWQRAQQSPRFIKDFLDAGVRRVALPSRVGGFDDTWESRCRAFLLDDPTALSPNPSKNLPSKRTPKGPERTSLPGQTPHMRWPSTSIGRSSFTGGAPGFEASNRVEPSWGCLPISFLPTTVASTSRVRPRSPSAIGAKPNWQSPGLCLSSTRRIRTSPHHRCAVTSEARSLR